MGEDLRLPHFRGTPDMAELKQGGKQTWNLMLAYLAYRDAVHPAVVDFLLRTRGWADRLKAQGIIGDLHFYHDNAAPVNMVRNRIAKYALDHDVDIIVMVDDDMGPDMVDSSHAFVPESFQFVIQRWEEAPTVVVAPACTAPPEERPVVGRWRTLAKGSEVALDLYTREEAAAKQGIQPEAVAGLGLCMIDCRVFRGFYVKNPDTGRAEKIALRPPWFYWEWDSEFQTNFVTGEDTSFTRDVAALGARYGLDILFVNWDCWAGHFKTKFVGKPSLMDWRTLNALFGKDRELALARPQPSPNGHRLAQQIADLVAETCEHDRVLVTRGEPEDAEGAS